MDEINAEIIRPNHLSWLMIAATKFDVSSIFVRAHAVEKNDLLTHIEWARAHTVHELRIQKKI